MAAETTDGSVTFSSGQNASRSPDQIGEANYYSGVNLNSARGSLNPRYGLDELIFTFTEEEYVLPTFKRRTYENLYRTGKYQGAIPYRVGDFDYNIVFISGTIFIADLSARSISPLLIADGSTLDEYVDRFNSEPAGRFLVIHDYPSYPVIIENFTARRADPTKLEVPISKIGAYNQSRLIVANGGNEFTGSDPVSIDFPDAPITFEEVLTPSTPYYQQIFQLPTNYNTNDPIVAMTFLPFVDGSTQLGALLISAKNAVYAYHTETPRDQWESPGFGSLFIPEIGFAGPKSFASINSDVFFLGSDGQFRSISMSRDAQSKWSKVPLSREVENYLKTADPALLKYCVVCYFKNKLFILTNPFRTMANDSLVNPVIDYAHGGMVVLAMDNMSTFTEGQSPPAWDGLWTGIRMMDMFVNNERAYIMAKEGGQNKMYEVRPDLTYDIVGKEKRIKKIQSKIYTREYTYKQPFVDKRLKGAEFAIANVKGEFELVVKYRTSPSSRFLDWKTFIHDAPWRICDLKGKCGLRTLVGHDFTELNIGFPEETDDNEFSRNYSDVFRKIQLYIEIEGINWEIKGLTIRSELVPVDPNTEAYAEYDPAPLCAECSKDWFIEEVDLCHETIQEI